MSFYLNSCLLFCFILFFCSYKGKAQALELKDVLKISLENSSLAVQLQKNVLIKDLDYSELNISENWECTMKYCRSIGKYPSGKLNEC